MRLPDDAFSLLYSLNEFSDYYDTLTAAEMMEELDRLYTNPIARVMHQHAAMHRRFVDYATQDEELIDHNRSMIISVSIGLRELIDNIIIPALDPETAERLQRALAATDDYIRRFAVIPTAAEAILSKTKNHPGPFKMGVVGELLAKRPDTEDLS